MGVRRKCELCSKIATIFCESDQASLCHECDSRVHGANFLVAKHSRTLLCHVCQSPTQWAGSGPKFGPTISYCPTCLTTSSNTNNNNDSVARPLIRVGDHHDDYGSDDDDDDDDDDGFEEDESHMGEDEDEYDDEEDDEEEEENQVVPWSYSVSHPR